MTVPGARTARGAVVRRASPVGGVGRGFAVAAVVTFSVRRMVGALVPPEHPRWTRVNHRGAPISLLEGPAVAAGLVASAVVAVGGRRGAACAVAATGAAAFGLLDDLSEDTSRRRKGLRGHLGALRHGELTTGALKVLGIGLTSLVAAAVAGTGAPGVTGAPAAPRVPAGRPLATGAVRAAARLADVATSGALIAASANLVNLLDLRPGRALKASALGAAVLAPSAAPVAGAALGAVASAIGPDLAEVDMLGDGGANALGALLGTGVVLAAPRPVRLALLAGAVALTVASEKVSFTQVIARTPVLREIDAWGRR